MKRNSQNPTPGYQQIGDPNDTQTKNGPQTLRGRTLGTRAPRAAPKGTVMNRPSHTHPRFDRPPVVETVFSIEFTPLPRWEIPFFGLYWSTIRERYPRCSSQAALLSQIENLSDEPTPQQPLAITLSPVSPHVRCWFFNEQETELIQIQRDRFIFNWKKGIVDQSYPHYERIRPVFSREWDQFRAFVEHNDLGKWEIRQCEVAYINHIELGIGWKDYAELSSVLAPWSGAASGSFLQRPEDVEIGARYRLPDGRGRLYIRTQPAIRHTDQKEILQLTLTVRGRPSSQEPASVFDWFDFAQPWVAQSFVDFTTEEMHSLWGKRED